MKRRRTKKDLRVYESYLAEAVSLCLSSPLQTRTGEFSEAASSLFRRVNNVVYLHLMLDRKWPHRERFLEYLENERLTRRGEEVQLTGDFIWWPLQSAGASDEWWPNDRIPETTRHGGKYLIEPFHAKMRLRKGRGQQPRLVYEFIFGVGKTRRVFTNLRGASCRL